MALAISSILIDGTPVPLTQVVADITIRHGRATYFDAATAATCQLTLIGVSKGFVESVALSRPLVVNYRVDGGPEVPRFTGRTTDAALDGDELTVIAVGRLSTLDGYTVGKVAYVAQGWTARVNTIFNEAGLAAYLYMPKLGGPPNLVARPIGPISLAQYLDELLEVGAAVASDMPDGRILIEPAETRTAAAPTTIGPEKVQYTPVWVKVLPGANTATVAWGTANPQAVETWTYAPAVTQYGPRPYALAPSPIALQAQAVEFAQRIVNRQALPRWTTPAATLLDGVELQIGAALKLLPVPAPAPYAVWTAFVEGWTDHVESNGDRLTWTIEVALSDPSLSGVIVHVVWSDLPTTDKWNTIDPTVTWANADDLA